jgi:hypothetical protein
MGLTSDRDFVTSPSLHYSIIASLRSVELAAFVRPGHTLARGRVTDKDLSRCQIVDGPPAYPTGAPRQWTCAPTITCDNYAALRTATLQSDAVGIAAKCRARGTRVTERTEYREAERTGGGGGNRPDAVPDRGEADRGVPRIAGQGGVVALTSTLSHCAGEGADQRPVNFGGRFSRNALAASPKSDEFCSAA